MNDRLPRRDFLRLLGTGLLAAGPLGALAGCAGRSRNPRPNIVFVLTDDHAFDFMSCAGHPWIRTPSMDRLARDGVRFENAFTVSSLCSPSRASFLSGLYPHEHGVCSNEVNDLPLDVPTFPRLLQEAGYRTAFVGKWHQARSARPRPGFDHWVSFSGQGEYFRNTFNIDGEWRLSHGYITDDLTQFAVDFIERAADGPPFMLVLSHKAAHQPFQPAPRHAHLYADVVTDMVPPTGDRLDLKPDWGGRLPDVDRHEFLLAYARTLAAVDDGLGRLLDTLDDFGVLNDTAVIYAGDNGFMMGEHGGLWDKRAAYERSIRIPLMIRFPRGSAPAKACPSLSLNIDVMPTVLSLAGVPPPAGLPGLDLAGLAAGAAARDAFLYEYFHEAGRVPTLVAVRTERYKLVTYPENPEYPSELYDLRYDPDELMNRAQEEGYASVRRELEDQLRALKERTGYRTIKPVVR